MPVWLLLQEMQGGEDGQECPSYKINSRAGLKPVDQNQRQKSKKGYGVLTTEAENTTRKPTKEFRKTGEYPLRRAERANLER